MAAAAAALPTVDEPLTLSSPASSHSVCPDRRKPPSTRATLAYERFVPPQLSCAPRETESEWTRAAAAAALAPPPPATTDDAAFGASRLSMLS